MGDYQRGLSSFAAFERAENVALRTGVHGGQRVVQHQNGRVLQERSGQGQALTLTFAAFDLLMSVDPLWFSTMFGVYYWAGGFVTFFAVLTLLTMFLQNNGRMKGIVSPEHFHDYGKSPRPQRKLGHCTLVAPDREALERELAQLRDQADELAPQEAIDASSRASMTS